MIDKVQKIREEVERMYNLLPVMDGNNISVNYADRICTTLEMYIDSLQKEPVSEKKCMFTKDNYTDEDRKVLCEDCDEKCEYNKKEKLLSDDLEEAAYKYADGENPTCLCGEFLIKTFKAGANWKEKQMMVKAIDAHCFGFQGAALFSFRLPADKYLVGSEVKVIVIKED